MLRVVVLGDSLAFGAGDETGKGIVGRLEDELCTRGVPAVQVRGFGVVGMITHELAARLEDDELAAESARADAIVLSIGGNDLFKTWRSRRRTLRAPIRSGELLLGRIDLLVRRLRELSPAAQVFYLSTYSPVPLRGVAEIFALYLAR